MFVALLLFALGADTNDYFNDGKLTQNLSVRELQGGVAGYSFSEWIVNKDGSWFTKSGLKGEHKLDQMTAKGQLTPNGLSQLARILSRNDLLGLPDKIGEPGKINEHYYVITFGDHITTIRGCLPRDGGSVAENIKSSAPKEAKNYREYSQASHIIQKLYDLTTGSRKLP